MDYIFYRIQQYYRKKEYIPVMMGIYFVFVLQISLFFLLGVILNIIFGGIFSAKHLDKTMFLTICVAIFLSLFVFDIFRYSRQKKVIEIDKRFHDNSLNEIIKVWQIFMMPVFIVVLSVIIIIISR